MARVAIFPRWRVEIAWRYKVTCWLPYYSSLPIAAVPTGVTQREAFLFTLSLSEHPMCNNWHLAMKFVFNLQLIRQNTVWPLSGKLAAFSVPCSSLSVSGDDRRKTQTPLVARPLFPPFSPTKSLKRSASQAIYIKFLEVLTWVSIGKEEVNHNHKTEFKKYCVFH